MDITTLLALVVEQQASDLHLSAGHAPVMRVHGDICPIGGEILHHSVVHAMLCGVMNDEQRKTYASHLEVDFALEIAGLARFRVNAFHQHRGAAAVFRAIAKHVPTLQSLNAPSVLTELILRPSGLILVTGPTGSGKSTTLAAMVHYLNAHTRGHILTIEDPVEFIHSSLQCLVNQREVGQTTHSFSMALRSALREDPDCILVGEMRDLETIRLALTAAETGHLVLATLHTNSATKTIDRIVDVFAAEERTMVRMMLSESLLAVVSQTLCRTCDAHTPGRVAAYEIMLGTPAIRNLIREGKVAQMSSAIQTGASVGMQTLDQGLMALVRSGLISLQEARRRAKSPETFSG